MIDNYSLIKRNKIEKENFVINDIELFVDPTSISIHKENLEYSYKTLRSKGSTKVASGNGALHLQLNLVFSPEMIIQLHRLICQIRNIPFVYIKNDFIERSIGVGFQSSSSHFTVFGFALNNHQSSPGSFVCQIDLRYFNTQPYSETVEYLHDYKYISKDSTNVYKYTHGVFEKYSRIKKTELREATNYSILNINDSSNTIYQELSKEENPYKKYEYNMTFYDPRYSNAYKRYSNYIQYQSLKENFGIQIFKDKETNYEDVLTLRLNENLYNAFESSDIIYPFYSIEDDELLEFNKHLSFAILSKCLDFRIYFKNFIRHAFNPKLLKEFRKTIYSGVTKNMTYDEIEKKKRKNFESLMNYKKDYQHSKEYEKNLTSKESSKDYYFLRPYSENLFILHYPGFNGTIDVQPIESFGKTAKFIIKSDSGKETISGTGQLIDDTITEGLYAMDENNLDLFILNESEIKDLSYIDTRENLNEKKYELSDSLNKLSKPKDGVQGYQIYSGRNGYDTIFEKIEAIAIQTQLSKSFLNNLFGLNKEHEITSTTNRYSESILTSFGGNFNHIISSIPISGQPYPTHQFLGSIEPTYNFSFIGSAKPVNKKNVPVGIQDLEHILNQCVLQAKTFSVVPDASNIAIDSIITRLLGTFKEDTLYTFAVQDKGKSISSRIELKPNMSLHSSELFTIEGSPNAVGYNVRLSESKHYIQEEIKQAATTEHNYEKYLKKYSNILKTSQYARKKGINLRPIYNNHQYMNWNTKNYTSSDWYSKIHSTAKNKRPSKEHDINAYHLCLLLDEINRFLSDNKKIQIFSTYRGETLKKDGVTPLLSSHSVGSATDVIVEGMSSAELAAYIELLLKEDKISQDYGYLSLKKQNKNVTERSNKNSWVGLGVYGDYSVGFFQDNNRFSDSNDTTIDIRKNDYNMDRSKNYFLHIDLNLNVIFDETSITKRSANSLRSDRRRWVGLDGTAAFRTSNDSNQTAKQALNDFWNNIIKNLTKYISYNLTKLNYTNFDQATQDIDGIEDAPDNNDVQILDEEENDSSISPSNKTSLRNEKFKENILNENIFNNNESLKDFLRQQNQSIESYKDLDIKNEMLKTSNDASLYERQITLSSEYIPLNADNNNPYINQLDVIKRELSKFKNIDIRYEKLEGDKIINSFGYEKKQLVIKIKKQNYKKERKINKELLNSFQALASIMLIEPYLYLDDVNETSIENEMNRIITELFDIDVLPLHYNYIENNFLGLSHGSLEKYNDDLSSNYNTVYNISDAQGKALGAGGLTIALGALGLLLSAPAVITGLLIGGGIAGITGIGASVLLEGVSESALLQMKRVLLGFQSSKKLMNDTSIYSKWISNNQVINSTFLNELKEHARKKLESEDKYLYKDFLNRIDQSDEVHNGISSFSEKIIYNTDIFKRFTDLSIRLKTSSAVRKMIIKETKNGDWDKYKFNGLSDRLLINSLEDYLKYLFLFPMKDNFTFDNDMADEVYEINSKGEVKPIIDRELFDKNNLIDIQINGGIFNYFEDRKESLKQNQETRLAFLKGLAKALLEESIVLNRDILEVENSELLTIFDGKSVFELLETNAYPDIMLPKSPEDFATTNDNPHIHPVFFIKDFNDYYKNNKTVNTYLKNRRSISQKIVKNSMEFMNQARNGAVFKLGNRYLENIKSLNGDVERTKEVFNQMLESNDLLMDTYEYPNINPPFLDEEKFNQYSENKKAVLTNVNIDLSDNELEKKANYIDSMNKALYEDFKDIRNMFGSKLGYKRTQIDANDYYKKLPFKNNPLEVNDYNPVSLSKDSAKGITNLPSMKNAFPTFRLYLVEEDNIFSDRLTAYDDFFYYNSVISFSIENQRDLPAATAKIQLQNISGLLDGTRKNVLNDIDIPGDIDEDALDIKNMYRNYADTIVLRHGINVQLRAGYDSNTNNLDILLSGRITDINYSNNNTVCNIIVQSFGVELDSKIKGASAFTDKNNHFLTTHHLLSHAILSPELKHFGRRKVGRYFQTSEAMEPSLDIEEYSNTDYFDFKYTRSFFDTLGDNQTYIFFALGFVPLVGVGKYFGKKIIGKLGGNIAHYLNFGGKALGSFGQGVYNIPILNQLVFKPTVTGLKSSYNIIFKNNKTISNIISTEMAKPNPNQNALIQTVARELQNSSSFLKNIFKRKTFGPNLPPTPELTKQASKLIVKQIGYENALKMGFINPTFKGSLDFIWKTYTADGFLKTVLRQFTFVAPLAGVSALAGGIVDGFMSGIDFLSNAFQTQQDDRFKLTEKILMSPQDDNIFSPDPALYMIKENKESYLSSLYNYFDASVLTFFGIDKEKRIVDAYNNSFILSEKRLDISKNENLYKINGQSVWKIFKDMSYRHPGYIFGIRPYGNSMEYRMFFGLPNQRYFSKQVTNNVIARLNRIEEGLSNLNDGLINEDILKVLYPVYDKNDIREKQNFFSTLAIDEYLRKTKDRFTPFRQYHYITAENNIISNDIVVSGHDLVNTINVHYPRNVYKDGVGSNEETIEVSSLYKVTANNKKPFVMKDPNGNIKGITNAFRWGMSELINKTKNLYQGSLLILGNTKINTHDVIILKDNITNMHGPLEVSYVIHSFDFQTGFITEVGVSALVTGNESLTYPTYNAMIEYEARRELFDRFSSYRTFHSQNDGQVKTTIAEVVKDIIRKRNEESGFKIEIDDNLSDEIVNQVFNEINNRKNNNLPNFISDVTSESGDAISVLTSGAIGRDTAETIIKTASFIIGSTSIVSSALAGNYHSKLNKMGMISSLGKGTAALYFGLGSFAVGLLSSFGLDQVDDSYKTGNLGKNYFKKAIFSSMKGGNNIQLYPLVKDGMPLLAGGFEQISDKDIWENVYGNIYNSMSDAVTARLSREKEYSEIGRKVLELSEIDDDWSFPTEILSSSALSSIIGQNRTEKLVGWYLSEND